MRPDNQNQYDFIMNSDHNRRSGGPNFGSKKRQLVIGSIFVLVVVIVVSIIASILFSGGGSNNTGLIAIQAHQTEIDRVITLGQKNIADPKVKQDLGTLQTTILSDKKQLSNLLSSRGVEVTKTQLYALRNNNTDEALSSALKTSNHDEILQQSVEALVEKYYSALNKAKNAATSSKEELLLAVAASSIEAVYLVD